MKQGIKCPKCGKINHSRNEKCEYCGADMEHGKSNK